jgi:hypothetical protein
MGARRRDAVMSNLVCDAIHIKFVSAPFRPCHRSVVPLTTDTNGQDQSMHGSGSHGSVNVPSISIFAPFDCSCRYLGVTRVRAATTSYTFICGYLYVHAAF